MAHSEKCPVCDGKGKVVQMDQYTAYPYSTTGGNVFETCHGCGGTGWVVVVDMKEYHPIGYVVI